MYVVPLLEAMMKKVHDQTVRFQWVKDMSQDGAVRILDGRHLGHCHEYSSLTCEDQVRWILVKPKDLNMRQIYDSTQEFAYDPGNDRYAYLWQESFIDNKPNYGSWLGSEKIGDYQEATLAVARDMRQHRWDQGCDRRWQRHHLAEGLGTDKEGPEGC